MVAWESALANEQSSCLGYLSLFASSVMEGVPPTLLQKGSCNTDCSKSKCTTQYVDRNWNGKYFYEKLTLQLLYLNHVFLIGHMLSVHEHMLCLVFVMLLPNYCIMVNFHRTHMIGIWNTVILPFSDHGPSYRDEYLLGHYVTERGQGRVGHANTCAVAEQRN